MENKQQYKDYYYILGITPDATSEEIRDAYGDLYEKYGPHVSVSGHDPDTLIKTFKDISEAYETLMDPNKRREYDQTNLPHLQKTHLRQLWGKMTGVDPTKDTISKNDANETNVQLEITLREAYKGIRRQIRIDEQLPCNNCINLKPVNRLQCGNCRGTGTQHNMREELVEIPPGAYDRMQRRLMARGKYDPRAQRNGDLIVDVKVRQHSFFTVLGRDVACTIPVTLLEAVLGGEVECPTPTGKVIMKLQPLTQSGRVYRLKGMGLAGADFLVTIEVTIPTQLSAEEVTLFRKLKDVSTIQNPRDSIIATLKAQDQS